MSVTINHQTNHITATNGSVTTDGRTGSNLIINGAMQVAQRGTSVTGLTGTAFLLDRFKFTNNDHGTWTLSQDTDAPAGFSKSMKMLCTTADSSVGSSDYSFFLYKLEGNEVQQLASGTGDAKNVTLSFWVKSNVTGTFSAILRNEDNNRQCGGAYTVNSSGTWEYKTVTIPPDTVAGYTDDNTTALQIEWWLGAGSTFTGGTLPTSWETSSNADRAGANTVDVGTVTNGYFQITGVQLEVGDTATPFEHRSYGDELARCQRYYYRRTSVGSNGSYYRYVTGFHNSTSSAEGVLEMPVEMRATPSLSSSGTFAAWDAAAVRSATTVSLGSDGSSKQTINLNISGISGGTVHRPVEILSSNNSSSYLELSAEL